MVDEKIVDKNRNREMGNGKMDRENGRMGEDVEMEGEK